jgi:hypothetical protein
VPITAATKIQAPTTFRCLHPDPKKVGSTLSPAVMYGDCLQGLS